MPEDAKNPRLLINEGEFITHFIEGHENSPLHGKTEFGLEQSSSQSPQARVEKSGDAETVESF